MKAPALYELTVKREGGGLLSYSTLIEGIDNIRALGSKDSMGREIITMKVKASDGNFYTYTPSQILAVAA